MQQPNELQQLQAELNQTAVDLVREQRKNKQAQNNLQLLLQAVLDLAKTDDVEIKTFEDAVNYLNTCSDAEKNKMEE